MCGDVGGLLPLSTDLSAHTFFLTSAVTFVSTDGTAAAAERSTCCDSGARSFGAQQALQDHAISGSHRMWNGSVVVVDWLDGTLGDWLSGLSVLAHAT